MSEFTGMLTGNPEIMLSSMIKDIQPEGLAPQYEFLLDNTILLFLRRNNPTRRDPSFMKSFRLRGQFMKPAAYRDDRARSDIIGFDWTQDIKVTNTIGAVRINANNS